jgi:hypothetical protein
VADARRGGGKGGFAGRKGFIFFGKFIAHIKIFSRLIFSIILMLGET